VLRDITRSPAPRPIHPCIVVHCTAVGNFLLIIKGSQLKLNRSKRRTGVRTILFECPFTGAAISTGIETEPISFCRISEKWLRLYCPTCCRFHGAKIWLNPESSAPELLAR
jgi:hypothetical protein